MRLSLFRSNRPPSEAAEVPDLDVTPIMNMFIILIPFLVSMAVFTHLSIVEFSLPPNVGNASLDTSSGKPKLKLTIVLGSDFMSITRGATVLDSLSCKNGNFPFDSIAVRLAIRKQQVTDEDSEIGKEVVIASRDAVRFKNVVKTMDMCKELGFDKVGLSSAPSDPESGKSR